MHKKLVLAASIILVGYALPSMAARHADPHDIDVVSMAAPAPISGTAYPVFFDPGSAALTPTAQRIVTDAVRQAGKGRQITLVVSEAAGPEPGPTAAPVWRARITAVRRAIVHSPAGQLSENGLTATRVAER